MHYNWLQKFASGEQLKIWLVKKFVKTKFRIQHSTQLPMSWNCINLTVNKVSYTYFSEATVSAWWIHASYITAAFATFSSTRVDKQKFTPKARSTRNVCHTSSFASNQVRTPDQTNNSIKWVEIITTVFRDVKD